jgi:hypothetical protein
LVSRFIAPTRFTGMDIPKSSDLPPFDCRVCIPNGLWDLLGCFSKHRKVPEHGVACQIVCEKARENTAGSVRGERHDGR